MSGKGKKRRGGSGAGDGGSVGRSSSDSRRGSGNGNANGNGRGGVLKKGVRASIGDVETLEGQRAVLEALVQETEKVGAMLLFLFISIFLRD